jgi:hypothetical protein
MRAEPKLLARARRNLPSLPFDDIDLLIVDFLGKDISGTGMDPHIIGRVGIRGVSEPRRPRIHAIVVRDVTPASHGNALGIGFADVIPRRLFDKIDFDATYENIATSSFLERAKVPFVADDDSRAIEIALRSCGPAGENSRRILRIRDTLHLEQLYASEALLKAASGRSAIEVLPDHELLLAASRGSCPDRDAAGRPVWDQS